LLECNCCTNMRDSSELFGLLLCFYAACLVLLESELFLHGSNHIGGRFKLFFLSLIISVLFFGYFILYMIMHVFYKRFELT
jgi:hypothetical protein